MNTDQYNGIIRALIRLKTAVVNAGANRIDDVQTGISGTTVTLLHTPTFVYGVYYNGQKMTVTTDYSITGTTLTFTWALVASDVVSVVYTY